MRDFIDAVTIMEAVEDFDVRGRDVSVFVNPTPRALSSLMDSTKYGLVRGFATNRDIYLWDANDAIHHQIWRQVTDEPTDVSMFMIGNDFDEIVGDSEREYKGDGYFDFFEDSRYGFLYLAKTAAADTFARPPFARTFNLEHIDQTA